MKKIKNKLIDISWIGMLIGMILSGISGCSNIDTELMGKDIQSDGVTRAYDYSCTLNIETAGTLDSLLVDKMGADSANVQELILTGVFSSEDAKYIRNNLSGPLARIDLSGITSFQENGEETGALSNDCFHNMNNLVEVILPENGILKIGNSAFSYCTSLKSINIPKTVTTIGNSAFENCDSLSSIVIPSSVTSLGTSMFNDDASLTSANIQASVEQLPDNFFDYCRALTDVEFSDSIKSFGSRAFRHCSSMTDPKLYKDYELNSEYILEDTGYKEVDLSHLTVIPVGLFNECDSLKKVIFSPDLTEIGYAAFNRNYNLSDFTLPDKLEYIRGYSMSFISIDYLVIPNSVKEIDGMAFQGATFTTLSVGSSLESYGNGWRNAFTDCGNFTTMYWNNLLDVPSCPTGNGTLYLTSINGVTAEYDSSWKTVYVDGEPFIEGLVFKAKENETYYVSETYTAEKVQYIAEFNTSGHYTGGGVTANWQTIVLPFKPTKILSAKQGRLAPFNSGVEGAKPFWLRELTSEGFVDVTEIEPNKPYIIAMPYNPDIYMDDYNIQGKVVFEADSVVLQATDSIELEPCVGPDFTLYPTYSYVKRAGNIYALNTNGTFSDVTQPGSAFVRSYQAVYPFEAYVMGTTTMRGTISLTGTRAAVRGATGTTRGATGGKRGIPQIDDM